MWSRASAGLRRREGEGLTTASGARLAKRFPRAVRAQGHQALPLRGELAPDGGGCRHRCSEAAAKSHILISALLLLARMSAVQCNLPFIA